ncbi:MAG: 6-pyruvoyl-tetrahydropterin synthase-related protein [Anaerolineales bacterium]
MGKLRRWWGTERARDALGVSLGLILGVIAAVPLLGEGMVYTRAGGDSPFLLQRTQQLATALAAGAWPVRWMPDANLGLGYAAFNYYAALPYYIAAALHLAGLGLIAAVQATQVAGFLLGSLSAYGLSRALGQRRPAALAAAAFFTFVPYHLVNVYVRGDALSEFWAMGLLVTALWAVARLRARPGPGAAALLALSYAALVLSHNVTALIASPFVGLVLLGSLWRSEHPWRTALWGGGALAVGLLLSAWFWVPALAESDLVQLGHQTTGYFDFRNHFRGLDLVQRSLAVDYAIIGNTDPFRMGLVQALLTALGLVAVALSWRDRQRRPVWLAYALGALGATLLITPLSRPVWERLPLLPYAQFPWRFLSVEAALSAPLVGLVAEASGGRGRRAPLWRAVAAGVLVVASGAAGLARLTPDRVPLNDADVTLERMWLFEGFSGNIGGTVRAEYLPEEMSPRYYTSPQLLARSIQVAPWALPQEAATSADAVAPQLEAELVARDAANQRWRLSLDEKARVVFPLTYAPNWAARVDGEPLQPEAVPGLGLLGLALEGGVHEVALSFGRTPRECLAERASLVGVALWAGMAVAWVFWPCAAWRRRGLGALAVPLALAGGVYWLSTRSLPVTAAEPLPGPLVMDLASYPYLHHEPEGMSFGSAHLADYRYASDHLAPGETLIIDLDWDRIAPDEYLRIRLLPLSAHILNQSTHWAAATVPIDTAQMRVELALPDDTAPGVYVLRLGVQTEDEQSLPITNVRGTAQSRTSLAPIWVRRDPPREQDGSPLATYGYPHEPPVLSLLGAETVPIKDHSLELRLTWRAEQTPARNYAVSLRYLRVDGTELDAVDIAPLSADYPTGLWRPQEVVATRTQAEVGKGDVQPGDVWRVVLYDRQTLVSIGTADLPVVWGDD